LSVASLARVSRVPDVSSVSAPTSAAPEMASVSPAGIVTSSAAVGTCPQDQSAVDQSVPDTAIQDAAGSARTPKLLPMTMASPATTITIAALATIHLPC